MVSDGLMVWSVMHCWMLVMSCEAPAGPTHSVPCQVPCVENQGDQEDENTQLHEREERGRAVMAVIPPGFLVGVAQVTSCEGHECQAGNRCGSHQLLREWRRGSSHTVNVLLCSALLCSALLADISRQRDRSLGNTAIYTLGNTQQHSATISNTQRQTIQPPTDTTLTVLRWQLS